VPSMWLFDKQPACYKGLWKKWWAEEGSKLYSPDSAQDVQGPKMSKGIEPSWIRRFFLKGPRPKTEQALNSSLITRHPVLHVVKFSQIVQCLRQVRQIRLWILLCQLAIDLQRFLVFLPGFLHPLLLAVKHPQVVPHHRHVR
jgi:hypothetical protein